MKYFNISIHDVAGINLMEVRELTKFLTELDIKRITYLIIPNYHKKENIWDFKNAILNIVGQHEVALHGYSHIGKADKKYSPMKLFTDGEGEFLSLQNPREKIENGLKILRHIGLNPTGFIPPAWLMRKRDLLLFKETGLTFLNTRNFIYDLRNDKRYLSPVITFSSRGLLEVLSVKTFRAISQILKNLKIIRIAIHPKDWKSKDKRTLLRDLIQSLKKKREEVYFSQFLDAEGAYIN